MSLTIPAMQLAPNARCGAELVLAAHPDACFTSGRRDLGGQARAMAKNVIRYGSAWLKDTYRDPALVSLLMTHTEEHPEQQTEVKLLAKGFYDTLSEHYAGQLTKFPHLRGDAFDLAWPRLADGQIDRAKGQAICTTIETLPVELGLKLLLKKEGRLDVIHAEFAHAVESVQV
jgi:hypothetical protein